MPRLITGDPDSIGKESFFSRGVVGRRSGSNSSLRLSLCRGLDIAEVLLLNRKGEVVGLNQIGYDRSIDASCNSFKFPYCSQGSGTDL